MNDELDCALDLMRRMPPSSIEDNLSGLIDIVPDLTEQLLSMVDQPLKVAHDSLAKRDYLLCDYNRDGDSYRCVSPPVKYEKSEYEYTEKKICKCSGHLGLTSTIPLSLMVLFPLKR